MNFDLLASISETPGAPGFEEKIRSLIIDQIKDHCDEYHVDGIGNLVVHRKGGGPRVMAAAHMDEISLIAKFIDDQGFIRFHTLGGFDPTTLSTQRVIVHGKEDLTGVIGTKPIHAQSPEERKKAPKTENFFIDVGLPVEKVRELVPVGSPITRERTLKKMGDFVTGKSLDNRVSVYMLVETIRQLNDVNCDFYGVFTVQEEVGIRGARVATNKLQPEVGITLDVTLSNDIPGVDTRDRCTKIGDGIGIKIMDGSAICTPALISFAEQIADKYNITYQRELLTAGGTDTSAIQYLTGQGAHVTGLSIPLRYMHSTVETVAISDIDNGINLLKNMVHHLNEYQIAALT